MFTFYRNLTNKKNTTNYNMWLYFLALIIIASYLTIKITIKVCYGFWSSQPVYHIYDLHYRFYTPDMIQKTLPVINKNTNLINITTQDTSKLSTIDSSSFCNFIRSYYLQTPNANYNPSDKNLITPFQNNSQPSYLSVYKISRLLVEKNSVIPDKELIGTMTSRPVTLRIRNKNIPSYYTDNLCIKPEYRKKNIAGQIIQTHAYQVPHNINKPTVFIFKREDKSNAIVPIVFYHTYMYRIPPIRVSPFSGNISLIEVTSQNLHNVLEFIYLQQSRFDCTLTVETSNILTQIKHEHIMLYVLLEKMTPIALYQFRNPTLRHGNDKAIEIGPSLSGCIDNIFIYGFWEALRVINKEFRASNILVEELGDNQIILNYLEKQYQSLGRSPMSFYLYNYISEPVLPSKTYMLF